MLIGIEKEIKDYCWEKVKLHKVKDIQSEIKTIIVGDDTNEHDITYGFVGNSLIVTGFGGNATYRFDRQVTIDSLKDINPMMLAKRNSNKDVNSALAIWKDIAKESINKLILDWCNANSLDGLNTEEKTLYLKLMSAVENYSYDIEIFWRFGLLGIAESNATYWFNNQLASILYDNCFGVSEKTMIHWLGLQIILKKI